MRQLVLATTCLLFSAVSANADSVILWLSRDHTVAVENLSVPASEYKSDGDPDTVELVLITKPGDGQSRISDDGEVVFLREGTPQRIMDALMAKSMDIRTKAFEARLKAAEGAAPPK